LKPVTHPSHLVIFGAGYVGTAIAREAIKRGMRVTALTRNPEKAAALRKLGVTSVEGDLAGTTWHSQIEGKVERVLNCVSSGGGGLAGYEQSYLRGMESILTWARAGGRVGTLVYTSSTSVYPQGEGTRVDESAPTGENGERGKVLVAAEDLLRAAGNNNAGSGSAACDRWFILRLAGIYGPERHHLLDQVRAGEVSGKGDYRLNLIHLEDICRAVWAAFDAPPAIKNEIFNVTDDGAATKAEITAWIAGQIGAMPPRFSGEPARGRRVIPPDRVIANGKLKALLGWRPRYPSFREGYASLLSA
jgi:nucleoside-diphosphate-sugar epimerase